MYLIYRAPACSAWVLLGYTSTEEQGEIAGKRATDDSLDGYRVEYRNGEPEDYGDDVPCLDDE